MTPVVIGLIGIGCLFVLLILRTPVAFAMLAVGFFGYWGTFRGTEGKEIIELSDEAAQAFDDASATVVDQVISEAEAQGLNAAEFVDALESSTNGS